MQITRISQKEYRAEYNGRVAMCRKVGRSIREVKPSKAASWYVDITGDAYKRVACIPVGSTIQL